MKDFVINLFNNDVFLGAFWGAASIFVLERLVTLGKFYLKIVDRKRSHLNSLHRLTLEFNLQGGIINDNIYAIDHTIKGLEAYTVSFNRIDIIPTTTTYFDELLNLGLINELYAYQSYIRKVNSDIKDLNFAYKKIMETYTSKGDMDFYKQNVDELIPSYKAIRLFLLELQKMLKLLFAKTRIMQRKDVPFLIRVERLLTTNKTLEKLKTNELEIEIKKLDSEIKEAQEESGAIIEAIRKSL